MAGLQTDMSDLTLSFCDIFLTLQTTCQSVNEADGSSECVFCVIYTNGHLRLVARKSPLQLCIP